MTPSLTVYQDRSNTR